MAFSGGAVVCVLTVMSSVQCFEHLSPSNTLLLSEFEYDTDIQHDLFPHDGRSYFFHGDSDGDGFSTDYNLANLRPISPTPAFTLDPSYISPADVLPARAKRANRLRGKASKQRKREQQKERLSEEADDEDDDEETDDAKDASEVESTGVEDYAERYEQFIAKHFDDLESKRKKSEPQRKAPKPGKGAMATDGASEEEEDGDYKFDRVDYSSSEDYERIKAESEEQSRRLAKDPRNCRTYEKDGMVCSVCHDPASDSASESCAYATEPHHRKYAYVKERNYDSKKDDPKRKQAEAEDDDEDEEADVDEARELSAETRPERQTEATTGLYPTPAIRRIPPRPLRRPQLRPKPHQSATNGGGYRYQPIDLRSNRASMKLRAAADTETVPVDGEDTNVYVMDYGEPDEVAKVLAEFKTRDWSNCRKGKGTGDDELTCYQCTDAAGVNHEECMYVSESRLVASELLQPPPAMSSKLRKRKKVVALSRKQLAALEPPAAAASSGGGAPAKEKQTVKRTVSFRSFISGSGRGPTKSLPIAIGSDGDERVIHYEHHISHEVP
uniref:Uncharacterized protein n=1 Tax=Anopheles dirus TaxID=7168 RepID=A0A182NG66_9DIPT